MTTLTTTAACTRRLLGKLQENIKWARMKIKPNKSRSISIVKGELKDVRFCIGDDPIPTVSEQPVKSLGRWYNASLKDKEQVQQLRQDIINGLDNINKTLLPGKLKLWCLQFGLLPDNVATHHLQGPNNNRGEDGANRYFIHEEMAQCPTMPKQHQPLRQRGP
ncbi:hypothetical protein AAFF_G00166080 [Aldrovandia affinis]|uniref:Reverse transcriptase n=1 Tax=Aldrovandia affinis TaxID=143900 RepID=A0AAD7RM27_9TELE|nr:hypothetical protein AAFF_G00166080 [Aldrovandia affinis]